MTEEKVKYIAPLDEDKCVAIRLRSCIVYCYPVCKAVLEHGPKVLTRSGKVVKRVQYAENKEGDEIITGLLDEERLVWDANGWFNGDENNDLTLCIPERYWDKEWKNKIKMSNSDWALKYQRRHDTVDVPKELSERRKFRDKD